MKNKIIIMLMIILIALIICESALAVAQWRSDWTTRQNTAHEIADLARSIDLPETDPIIVRAQEIWWSDYAEPEPPQIQDCSEQDLALKIDFYSGILPYELTYNEETEELAIMLAKTIFAESRGIASIMEQAAIVQTVYNRTRSERFGYPTVYQALTAPNQFAYFSYMSTTDDYGRDLIALARDVMYRTTCIDKAYAPEEVGIILPADYFYYAGDGYHNYFRNAYTNGTRWTWELPNPYES